MDIHNNEENPFNVVNKENTNNSNGLMRKRQRVEKKVGLGMFTLEEDPKTFNEAMSLPDSDL